MLETKHRLFSSSKDLAAFGRAILLSSQLSPLTTRSWRRPQSHSSSLSLSVGAPWEIWTAQSAVSHGRVIDLYTKSGSLGEYSSLLMLVPDFLVTFSILAAGSDSDQPITAIAEIVLQSLLPIIEQVSRSQTCESLCGTYKTTASSSNSSVVLTVDDGPGLVVQKWISNGVDLFEVAQRYASATNGGIIKSIRLYPTNLSSGSTSAGETLVSYRALFETTSSANSTIFRIFDPNANQWGSVDNLVYGSIAVDDILFHLAANGSAMAVEPRALRQIFVKVEDSTSH